VRRALGRLSDYVRDMSLRRRVAGVVVAVLINGLVLLMLLTLAPYTPGRKTDEGALVTFTVEPPGPPAAQKQAVERPTEQPTVKAVPPPVAPPPPVTPPTDLGLIQLSHDELAQVDNAMKRPPLQRPQRDSGSAETLMAGQPDTPVAPGKGPHGETLYAADWYREPTQAELAAYRPTFPPPDGAYATIACRTIARYHVEDCAYVDESPPGYGLSRSVLNASWQFLVMPPRIGGRVMVGEWVRIRIIFRDVSRSAVN